MVYIIQHGNTSLYKIGYTTDIRQRLIKHYLLYNPVLPGWMLTIKSPDDAKLEINLHRQFQDKHIGRNEWFELTNDDISKIIANSSLYKIDIITNVKEFLDDGS